MSNLPSNDAFDEIQDFFAQEEFLAFFDFHYPKPGGRNLEGLCKVARPQTEARERVNYLCLTFIVDTPGIQEEQQIEALLGKLDVAAFKAHVPGIQAITSVPTSDRRAENYIHQMDLIFGKNTNLEVREIIPMIMFTIRQAGFKTERPQWWDEEAIKPQPSQAEKANWGNRLKALVKVLSK